MKLFFDLLQNRDQFVKEILDGTDLRSSTLSFSLFPAFSGLSFCEDSISILRRESAAFLRLWFLLYAFVGTQLAWTLRPFFGAPGLPFQVFRELGGNFYTDIVRSIEHILGSR